MKLGWLRRGSKGNAGVRLNEDDTLDEQESGVLIDSAHERDELVVDDRHERDCGEVEAAAPVVYSNNSKSKSNKLFGSLRSKSGAGGKNNGGATRDPKGRKSFLGRNNNNDNDALELNSSHPFETTESHYSSTENTESDSTRQSLKVTRFSARGVGRIVSPRSQGTVVSADNDGTVPTSPMDPDASVNSSGQSSGEDIATNMGAHNSRTFLHSTFEKNEANLDPHYAFRDHEIVGEIVPVTFEPIRASGSSNGDDTAAEADAAVVALPNDQNQETGGSRKAKGRLPTFSRMGFRSRHAGDASGRLLVE